MALFQVEGGHRLHGEITPQGAKNEALQILCAVLLTPERVVVRNVPDILDVVQLIELLAALGVEDKERILRALKQANGNRKVAAELLGIGRTTLYSKLEEYGLKYKFQQS